MHCRLCGCEEFETVLDFGEMALTGVFPMFDEEVDIASLHLIRCLGECGLVQLKDTADLNKMYGDNYGYRSGLNAGMVRHLHGLVDSLVCRQLLPFNTLVIDIGSNDGTTLDSYPTNYRRVGVDPTANKFREFYPKGVEIISEFFTAEEIRKVIGDEKAKIITSFAMFYDLPDPVAFAKDVASVLADDGTWCMELCYLPAMMKANAWDSVCQEHLSFYSLKQIEWVVDKAGLSVVDAYETDTNGGSFVVILCHRGYQKPSYRVETMRQSEIQAGLNGPEPYTAFSFRTIGSIAALVSFLDEVAGQNKLIYGLGASTKGNVLLQAIGDKANYIGKIGDVNSYKHGRVTPLTNIPIVSEEEALADNPDYLLVLPWHFRKGFMSNPKLSGRTLVFPLPQLEIMRVP